MEALPGPSQRKTPPERMLHFSMFPGGFQRVTMRFRPLSPRENARHGGHDRSQRKALWRRHPATNQSNAYSIPSADGTIQNWPTIPMDRRAPEEPGEAVRGVDGADPGSYGRGHGKEHETGRHEAFSSSHAGYYTQAGLNHD